MHQLIAYLLNNGIEYSGRFLHNDTTSISLQGEYEYEEGKYYP